MTCMLTSPHLVLNKKRYSDHIVILNMGRRGELWRPLLCEDETGQQGGILFMR